MAIELKIPAIGESVTEVEIGEWKKAKGARVKKDEGIVVLESEKATVELPAPVEGVLTATLKQKGDTAAVGEIIGYIDEVAQAPTAQLAAAAAKPASASQTSPAPPAVVMPAAERALAEHGLHAEDVRPTGPGGRLLKEDVLREAATRSADSQKAEQGTAAVSQKDTAAPAEAPSVLTAPAVASKPIPNRQDEVVPMTRLRRTVAERLVQAQQNAALLTTFNEIDMTGVLGLRKELGESFLAKHGVKLGFMSFFVRASTSALKSVPQVNAEIRGKDIVYHKYCDIGVAIGGGKGLVVPVLRNAERMTFAAIELAIADLAKRARENKLTLEELQGGTFTISNGGVYGSLLSTPIVNPPQSGVLGMHAIQERPVAREGQVVVRPMMYVALTYDHRLVDGREAVTFLKQVKDFVEDPVKMLIDA
jgi:2-oxoglutarate dehydrogenase E2 component (dihydrolipoamide succinyltransferase)